MWENVLHFSNFVPSEDIHQQLLKHNKKFTRFFRPFPIMITYGPTSRKMKKKVQYTRNRDEVSKLSCTETNDESEGDTCTSETDEDLYWDYYDTNGNCLISDSWNKSIHELFTDDLWSHNALIYEDGCGFYSKNHGRVHGDENYMDEHAHADEGDNVYAHEMDYEDDENFMVEHEYAHDNDYDYVNEIDYDDMTTLSDEENMEVVIEHETSHDNDNENDVGEHETQINVYENETFLDDGVEAAMLSHVPWLAHDPGGDAEIDCDDTIGHMEEFGGYADIDVVEVPDVNVYCDEICEGFYDDSIDCFDNESCLYDYYQESD